MNSIRKFKLVHAEGSLNQKPFPVFAPKIALIIPVYNEEENIERVLSEIEKLKKLRPRWNMLPIVINDCSKDNTSQILKKWEEQGKINVVTLPLNLGIGGAVQTGFHVAQQWGADFTLQIDGDGQHPADQIPKLVCPLLSGKADVIVGSRYILGAGGNVSTFLRSIGTQFFSIILRIFIGVKIHDTTSGFRAFNKTATLFLSKYYSDDYPEVEAYVSLAKCNFKILEVPIAMRPRKNGVSSITPLRSIYYVLKVLFGTIIGTLRSFPEQRR